MMDAYKTSAVTYIYEKRRISEKPLCSPHKPSSTMAIIQTPITDLFKIKHPIILAGNFGLTMQGVRESGRLMYHFRVMIGMNVAAGPELAAAVTNAGGLGVIG